MKNLEGAFPVLITPMYADGEVNEQGLRENIDYFIRQGVAGIVVNGSTGEFVSLTKEEKFNIAEIAVEQVNGRIPLVFGTAAETTKDAIMFTQQAEAAGADAALLINSYYAHPKDEEVYEHFKAVAESVRFPIMIYNNPFTSGVDIGTETILNIARDVENITHVKESSGDIRKARDIARKGKGYIHTFCGSDDLALESFLVGASGWISVAGNIAPRLVTELYNAVQENNLDRAWELYDQILPLCNFIEGSGKYVQIVKRAMDLQGLAGGPSRRPRLPLTEEEDATLQDILNQLTANANQEGIK
ncbi:4-hydroxy-tetrahydrodipicolinate synthase [Thalassobacillus devorans]|uniref:4-hydroxy-tetrahydrodipicolinate synthase n=1 Tax=Thalassobacillus devorans TaxID=279813 RepID=A0ABQ1NUC3_9BACI|nr:4-hydroxy-tetrahydrodipicolinate synthase [Thalassobacillus devorans]NIK28640.1 4-hydroxy-tetrahydrodipicolinate synthase [Thalassobacillus devorans]GGC84655.1 4-hydroxy-tetrahydrodipicolinate synthase [Thalassobacillus devorans]